MKAVFVIFLIALVIAVFTCNKLRPSHPQAKTSLFTEKDIRQYADSVAANVSAFDKQHSLSYALGDYVFSVIRSLEKGKPIIYVENGSSGEYGNNKETYILKDGEVVYYEQIQKENSSPSPFSITRAFVRNNIVFLAQKKSAETKDELKSISFRELNSLNLDFTKQLKRMNDALAGAAEFDLVFERLTEYPGARYLILSKPGLNGVRASFLIEQPDDLINTIEQDPAPFVGKKLNISWDRNQFGEMVYRSGSVSGN